MLKVTKVRIYLTSEQPEFLTRRLGTVRFAWNKALSIKYRYFLVRRQSLPPKKELNPLLVVAKKSRKCAWLKEVGSIAPRQAGINLGRAFQNFFRPQLPMIFRRFKAPKCNAIKTKVHFPVVDTVKNRCLARSIIDAGWHSLVLKLDYKAREAGKHLVKIDQWFESSEALFNPPSKAR